VAAGGMGRLRVSYPPRPRGVQQPMIGSGLFSLVGHELRCPRFDVSRCSGVIPERRPSLTFARLCFG
jgi:hypothetical protein